MARLPSAVDLGELPSTRSGRPIASFDTSAIGEGMSRAGNALASISAELAGNWDKVNSQALEGKFLQFKFDEAKRYDETVRNLKPEEAQGFTKNYIGAKSEGEVPATGYYARAKQFMAGVPEDLRPAYENKLFGIEQGLYGDATTFERVQQSKVAITGLYDTINTAILPRVQMAAALPAGDPSKEGQLQAAEEDAIRLIDENPALTPIEKEEQKRKVIQQIRTGFAKALNPSEAVTLDPNAGHQSVGERIILAESGGNPNATNPNSSAVGAGQFTDDTWLALIRLHRPDLMTGRSKQELLDLRTDPILSKDMVDKLAQDNGRFLGARGYQASPGNLYLAHFLGAAGAASMLGADPNADATDLNPAAAASNPTVFYNPGPDGKPDKSNPRTAAEIIQWAAGKMQGTVHTNWGSVLQLPYDVSQAIAGDAQKQLVSQATQARAQANAAYDAQLNDLRNKIRDGTAGQADIQSAYDNGKGWLTKESDRGSLVDLYNKVNAEGLNLADATNKMQSSYRFNPFDSKDQKSVNLYYEKGPAKNGAGLLEGDASAILQGRAIVARTNFIPDGMRDTLKQGIWGSDPKARDNAFTILDGLYRENPQAVGRAFSTDDIKRVQDYQALAPMLPPEELAKRLDGSGNPQDQKLREELTKRGHELAVKRTTQFPTEIVGAFDPGFLTKWTNWESAPSGPMDPMAQEALKQDYQNLFAERYAVSGNDDTAHAQAMERLKMKWGVSALGSGRTIMPYPPEASFNAIDGSHDWMDRQIDDLASKAYPGAQAWAPVALPSTQGDVGLKRTPTYGVIVMDKNGMLQTIMPPEGAKPGWPFDYQKAEAERLETFRRTRELRANPDLALPPEQRDDPAFRSFRGNKNNPMGRQLGPVPLDVPLRQ